MNASEEIPCSVDGCDRGAVVKDMCRAHDMRSRRGADLTKPLRTYDPGRICSVEDCERVAQSRELCKMHAKRDRKYGDPNITKPQHWPAPPRGEQHHNWLGDKISYDGAHWRVIRARGLASIHACTQCSKQASDWAYAHSDPKPLTEIVNGSLLEYSSDPAHYIPLCKTCHMAGDAAYRKSVSRKLERQSSS